MDKFLQLSIWISKFRHYVGGENFWTANRNQNNYFHETVKFGVHGQRKREGGKKCWLTLRYTTPDIHCRHRRHECDGGISVVHTELNWTVPLVRCLAVQFNSVSAMWTLFYAWTMSWLDDHVACWRMYALDRLVWSKRDCRRDSWHCEMVWGLHCQSLLPCLSTDRAGQGFRQYYITLTKRYAVPARLY